MHDGKTQVWNKSGVRPRGEGHCPDDFVHALERTHQAHRTLLQRIPSPRRLMSVGIAACWANWADSLHMIRQRHPGVADRFVAGLEGGVRTPALGSAVDAARHLLGVEGFVPPSWTELSLGGHLHGKWKTSNLAGVGCGSTRQLHGWNVNIVKMTSSPHWTSPHALC